MIAKTVAEVQLLITDWLIREANMSRAMIDLDEPVFNFGLSSVQMVFLITKLETALNCKLDPDLAWQYPSIRAISEYLVGQINE
jgi:myxalamid-type polyketide synthase MxaE and MxaD